MKSKSIVTCLLLFISSVTFAGVELHPYSSPLNIRHSLLQMASEAYQYSLRTQHPDQREALVSSAKALKASIQTFPIHITQGSPHCIAIGQLEFSYFKLKKNITHWIKAWAYDQYFLSFTEVEEWYSQNFDVDNQS